MLTEVHQAPSAESQAMLASLQSAVRKCLERKQRLDQYAIVWKDGQAQRPAWSPTKLQASLSAPNYLLREVGGT